MADVVVSGYMLRHPLAGNISAFFHYVLGLRRLGHDVLYLEEKGWDDSCFDPRTGESGNYPATGLEEVRRLFDEHCPDVPVVFVDADADRAVGMKRSELAERIASCDLLLDVGGVCWLEESRRAPARALVDLDPVFTQLGRFGGEALREFDVCFTYGTNIGQPWCSVPTAGVEWVPTVPPVVLDLWDADPPRASDPVTTVANWTAYGDLVHDGVVYGQKDREFRRLLDVPASVPVRLELALSGADRAVREELELAGWHLRDGAQITRDLGSYRDYIAGSQGELSAAKHAYVSTASGWISDRTVCYLAAGRPAIVQDTGFGSTVPEGEGLVAFGTPAQAAAAIEAVHADLGRHSTAARRLAADVFSHTAALPPLLERALAAGGRRAVRT